MSPSRPATRCGSMAIHSPRTATRLVSGPIEDPAAWLALVTAVAPAELTSHRGHRPARGRDRRPRRARLHRRRRMGDTHARPVSAALPLHRGRARPAVPAASGSSILVESVPATIAGFGRVVDDGRGDPRQLRPAAVHRRPPGRARLASAPSLVESRWISEGLASQVAAAVGAELGLEPPFDPAAEAEAHADAALPLDAWVVDPGSRGRCIRLRRVVGLLARDRGRAAGAEAIPSVLARVAASIGSYEPAEVPPEPVTDGGSDPAAPLTSRSFLDHLENVTDVDLAPLFERACPQRSGRRPARPARRRARGVRRARRERRRLGRARPGGLRDGRLAIRRGRRPDDGRAARGWPTETSCSSRWSDAGLSAPDRLHQAYRAYGGGAEAESELESERDVVEAYVAAAARVNAERSLIERLGLVGGHDPESRAAMAKGQFTEGDLRRRGRVDRRGRSASWTRPPSRRDRAPREPPPAGPDHGRPRGRRVPAPRAYTAAR